jgi:hypothetical protein
MNIGGIPLAAANLAGQALSPKGAEADRIAREAANLARAQAAEHRAEAASDVGETSDDVEANDGDADGRQLLDGRPLPKKAKSAATGEAPPAAPDPTGELGNELDLRG